MKKIILYGLLLMSLGACKKINNEPDKRPDVRLTEALTAYQDQLVGSPNGWIGYLYPKGGGGYTFKFKFDKNNRVVTYSDLKSAYSTTSKESSYRLRAAQVPSLYFDTYTYLNIIADPDPSISGGSATGNGKESDFEFSFISVSPDTIKLRGNFNKSDLVLVRAQADQGDDYIAKAFNTNLLIGKLNTFSYYYNQLTIGGKKYNMTINTSMHTISFYYLNNGVFTRFTTEYATAATGIVLRKPFIDGDIVVAEFHDFIVNDAAKTMTMVAGKTSASTTNEPVPLVIDTDAPRRMVSAGYAFTSDFGFTMNGVENAQKVTNIPGYLGIEYNFNYAQGYDALTFYYRNTQGKVASYAPAFLNQMTADGKLLLYGYAGAFGTSPGTAGATIITAVRTQLLDNQGYYVYETGLNSFDLVSVKDSKNWIRFY
ncbi:MAG: DUF4302 domain-containing protein [Candidatus Pedobacter colombiensis]|uniref:DUF4302 domain-containing protein n=1 Tax=Candidatus Pedobacter colombiensis TaxID=3121371 RepID=A0AAJ5W8A2_9SPHI|nr:DUF4302 domain-containing protein [Pedobacter sp.]WEK19018.1 MAG: DUF4302 domain-containing protein [Pedobacter sp.]